MTLFEVLTGGAFDSLTGNIAGNLTKIFLKSQMPRGLLGRGGGWAVLELTGSYGCDMALVFFRGSSICVNKKMPIVAGKYITQSKYIDETETKTSDERCGSLSSSYCGYFICNHVL